MRQSSIGTVALGVFCIALEAQGAGPKPNEGKAQEAKAARAEARGDKAEAKAEKAGAKAERAEAKADKAQTRAEARAERVEARAEARAERAEAKAAKAEARADSKAARAASADEHGHEAHGDKHDRHPGMGRGHAQRRSAMRELHEELARGKLDRKELEERLGELRKNVKERQKEHRQALARRYGSATARAPVREELRHHARRSAFLNRALLVAQTQLDPKKDGGKTVERIEKLIEKEDARHERAMQRFENAGGEGAAHLQKPEQKTEKPEKTELNAPAKGTEP